MLISIIIMFLVLGALLYVVDLLPIDGTVKRIIQVIAIVVIAIYLLRMLPLS